MVDSKKQELKIRALLEKISSLTTNYENQVADLRVELTLVTEQLEQLAQQMEEMRAVDEERALMAQEREEASSD